MLRIPCLRQVGGGEVALLHAFGLRLAVLRSRVEERRVTVASRASAGVQPPIDAAAAAASVSGGGCEGPEVAMAAPQTSQRLAVLTVAVDRPVAPSSPHSWRRPADAEHPVPVGHSRRLWLSTL